MDEGWGVDWTVNQASMIWGGGGEENSANLSDIKRSTFAIMQEMLLKPGPTAKYLLLQAHCECT